LEARVDIILSWSLRLGVLLCAGIILAGCVGALLGPAASAPDPQAAAGPDVRAATIQTLVSGGLLPERAVAHSVADVAAGLARGNARSIVASGLMLLIALPLVRVALSAVTFSLERDWLYVTLALVVLALLVSGLLLGRAL
jgi:uncharacterized membrane protein